MMVQIRRGKNKGQRFSTNSTSSELPVCHKAAPTATSAPCPWAHLPVCTTISRPWARWWQLTTTPYFAGCTRSLNTRVCQCSHAVPCLLGRWHLQHAQLNRQRIISFPASMISAASKSPTRAIF